MCNLPPSLNLPTAAADIHDTTQIVGNTAAAAAEEEWVSPPPQKKTTTPSPQDKVERDLFIFLYTHVIY